VSIQKIAVTDLGVLQLWKGKKKSKVSLVGGAIGLLVPGRKCSWLISDGITGGGGGAEGTRKRME